MITVVGVGALGSHVALLLRNEKAGLRLIDFDRVETKNTQSQFHTKMSLGKNKAHALTQAFHGMFGVKVDSKPTRLTENNAGVLLEGSTVVLDCTDNLEARKTISSTCRTHKLKCLHGGLAASGDFARIVWDEYFVADAAAEKHNATCVDGEHLPFFAVAAAYMAVEVQRFLRTGRRSSFQVALTGVTRIA